MLAINVWVKPKLGVGTSATPRSFEMPRFCLTVLGIDIEACGVESHNPEHAVATPTRRRRNTSTHIHYTHYPSHPRI